MEAGGEQNAWVVGVVAGQGGIVFGQIQGGAIVAGQNLGGAIVAGQNLGGAIVAGQNQQGGIVAGQNQQGGIVAGQNQQGGIVAGQNLAGLPMIVVEHMFAADVIQFVVRPAPLWAIRFSPAGVPLAQRQPASLSDEDSSNSFVVKLSLRNVHFVPAGLASVVVRGGETIEQLTGKLFTKLEATNRWNHGRNFSVLFSTMEDNPLFIPRGTLIGELLKSHPSDGGICVKLDCILADHHPAHGIFAIAPPV